MATHFIHIGKTGGTAIQNALRKPRIRSVEGPLVWHPHSYGLRKVPSGDAAFFVLRDPIARFVSAYQSRLRKGRPRYNSEWTDRERAAFTRFPTVNDLAEALGAANSSEREHAQEAARAIRHLRPLRYWLGGRAVLSRANLLYVARLETLDIEWPQLLEAIGIHQRPKLPTDPIQAHRGDGTPPDTVLTPFGHEALRHWLADDFMLLEFCERLRSARGWVRGGVEDERRE